MLLFSEQKMSDHFLTSLVFLMVHKKLVQRKIHLALLLWVKFFPQKFKKSFEAHDIGVRTILCTQPTNNEIKHVVNYAWELLFYRRKKGSGFCTN